MGVAIRCQGAAIGRAKTNRSRGKFEAGFELGRSLRQRRPEHGEPGGSGNEARGDHRVAVIEGAVPGCGGVGLEAGFAEIDPRPWFGVFAPAATPRAVVDKIRRDIAAILAEPEFREKEITSRGNTAVGSTPEDFAAFIRSDSEYKGKLIRVSGAKAE